MKRLISTGLFLLLLYHTLACALVLFGTWYQEQHDLSARLTMYRSVDSMVEFFVPLQDQPNGASLKADHPEGFAYNGTFYQIVRLDVSGDTLHILGYEDPKRSFWQQDLLSLVQEQVVGDNTSPSQKKANSLLKNFLKEYSQFRRSVLWLFVYEWRDALRIPSVSTLLLSRTSPVHSPPPKV
ncbi:MAG: hypothetical protein H7Z72_02490 [Bacteroidetes bacterium]|nr:hypothetical protein [Fibrella sp.]